MDTCDTPPKTKDNSSEAVKRPRGRPRKERTDVEKPKRPRGRPRKERTEEEKQNVHVEDLAKSLHKKEKSELGILSFDKIGTR